MLKTFRNSFFHFFLAFFIIFGDALSFENQQDTNNYQSKFQTFPSNYENVYNNKEEKITEKNKITDTKNLLSDKSVYNKEEEPSNIEILYNQRLKKEDTKLKQFGYEFFSTYTPYDYNYVSEDYIVGPGDTLILYLWGDPVDILNLEGVVELKIDKEGKIYIPNLGVFYVWNLTLDKIKSILNKEFSKKFKNFKLELSLGKLRTFPVFVSGYVNKPGIKNITASQTIFDILALAGGISKNGSLRNIRITRKNGEIINIDLYDFLLEGKAIPVILKEGDIIHIPPVGKTAAIYGAVKRPAIYELKDGENSIGDLIKYAGGILPSIYSYGIKLFRYNNDKLSLISETFSKDLQNKTLQDGDLVKIEEIFNYEENTITVEGKVKYPGKYSIEKYKTLSELINVIGILPDTNLHFAEVVRLDKQNKESVINFKPIEILKGLKDIDLNKQDKIKFYPKYFYKPIEISGYVENPKIIEYYPGITILDALKTVKLKDIAPNLKLVYIYNCKNEGQKESNNNNLNNLNAKLTITDYKNNSSINFYKGNENDNINFYKGNENDNIGECLIETIYLDDLLVKNKSEYNLKLSPGSKLIFRKVKDFEKHKTVTILGEVNYPGSYKYEQGMKLYDLIVKAGGYTKDAYPRGLIFIRESAKKLQQQQLETTILTMEEELSQSTQGLEVAGATPQEQALAKMAIEKQKKLLEIIKKKAQIGLGRIALDVPNSLKELKNSPDNIPLQDGDFIYVPAKPNYILVLGGVYNQISLPYRKGKTIEWYLKEVGGLKDIAKRDDIYIIKANGRVISQKNFESFALYWEDNKLNFGGDFYSLELEQGDTIVVPTQIKVPILWRPLIKDITQIIFQALSTAVLASRL